MKLTALLIALLFTVASFAQTTPFTDSSNTVLWGVVNARGDTSYLLGTCHIAGNTFVDGYAPINSKYGQATCVVSESADSRFFTQKSNWFKKLPARDRRLIKNYLKQTTPSFYLASCTKLPASFLYYLLLGELALRECHTYNESDVCDMDSYLTNKATTLHKKLYGLEQRDQSFETAVFAHTGVRNNEEAIAKIKDFVAHNDTYKDTIHKWCNCDEMNGYRKLAINYRFSKSSADEDSANAIVVDDRNDRWMPALKQIIDSNKAFIAVGLGHLYYKKGLIMQLAGCGYKVFPVAMHDTGPVTYVRRKRN